MTAGDLARRGATAISTAVAAGECRAVEVVEAFAARIAALNGAINALVDLDIEAALGEARAVDARVKAGETPPLAGVPVVVKDTIWVKGRRITQGSRLFADFVAPEDATAVARLRAAGAVVIGIGASPEFACKGITTSPLHGVTRHPTDPDLTPGGSSGGSAAALAAGFAPLALGTDAGGSARRPAAHCGVVGFKPSQGALPNGPGFREPFWGFSMVCPMGRSVDDVARLFSVIAGRDAADAETIDLDAPSPPARPPRLAWSPRLGLDAAMDEDVTACLDAAIAQLQAAGIELARADPVWPAGATELALMPIHQSGLALIHGEAWRADPGRFDPDVGAQIEAGFRWTGRDVAAALELASGIRRAVAGFFTRHDLLLCPTAPCVAWPHGRMGPETIGGEPAAMRGHAVFTPLFNQAWTPAISVPCGRGRAGLPVGIQIVGPRGADHRVLAFAHRVERALAPLTV